MRFPPLDSSEDFMRRGGLRFSLSLSAMSHLRFCRATLMRDKGTKSQVWHGTCFRVMTSSMTSVRDADCIPGREPRSVAASYILNSVFVHVYTCIVKLTW